MPQGAYFFSITFEFERGKGILKQLERIKQMYEAV